MALDDDPAALAGIGSDIVLSRRLVEADAVEAGCPLSRFAVGATISGGLQQAEAGALSARTLGREDGWVGGQLAFNDEGLHGQSP